MDNIFKEAVKKLRLEGYTDEYIEDLMLEALNSYDEGVLVSEERRAQLIVQKLLDYLMCPKKSVGYRFLVEAVILYYQNDITNFERDIYLAIAVKYNMTKGMVCSAIRHTVESMKIMSNIEVVNKVFKTSYVNFNDITNVTVIKQLAFRLSDLLESDIWTVDKFYIYSSSDLSTRVNKLLDEACCPKKFNGYKYFADAVVICRESIDQCKKLSMTEIYEIVAKKYKITVCSVERCIRNLLYNIYNNNNYNSNEFDNIFGPINVGKNGYPTNAEAINSAANKL